ncbi:MAG: proline iminopeptidase [Actinomycetota bacterium]|nr:proline iminopeptidase [Actinomycetota bacterium]
MADDGVELWFEVTGDGDGVPLVLCHGGPGMWDNLGPLATLLDHDRAVVRWDQRGCGRSGGAEGPFSLEQSLTDLDAIRRHLGLARWIVGGHSWGASLALRAVLADRTSAAGLLYLSGTGLGRSWHLAYTAAPAERLTADQLARCHELDATTNRTRAEETEWRALRWAPDFADRRRALELASIDAGAPWPVNLTCNAAINAETKTWDMAAIRDRCTSLGVPALLVHGEHDPRPPFAIDDLVAALPDATVEIIEDAGHLPWLERPGAVAAVLRPWLAARG